MQFSSLRLVFGQRLPVAGRTGYAMLDERHTAQGLALKAKKG